VDHAADVDALLHAVTPETRVLLLDNPNNPTGTALPHREIERLHAGLRADILLVIDQAYGEYQEPEQADAAFDLANRADNVLVTRTFSKAHGLAGERIGWGYGAPALIDVLNRIRGPFNVSASGQAAALAAIEDAAFVRSTREHNRTTRDAFAHDLASLGNSGLRVLPSEANFVLVMFDDAERALRVQDAIGEAGFAVRHLGGALSHALRITIGTADQMRQVASAIRGAMEDE
jgi:histidinol-phosphate aminotransferase